MGLQSFKYKLQKQDSKVISSEWESLDMALWPKESQGSSGNGNDASENPDDDQDNEEIGKKMAEIVSQDIFIEEGSIDLDDESEWSLDIA